MRTIDIHIFTTTLSRCVCVCVCTCDCYTSLGLWPLHMTLNYICHVMNHWMINSSSYVCMVMDMRCRKK